MVSGKPCEKKEARGLLRKIAEGTYVCGDPGMQFDSTIHRWHTCKGTARQNSTNPCSEYLFLDNTACNLASLNLMKFKRPDGVFDVESSRLRFAYISRPRKFWWITPVIRLKRLRRTVISSGPLALVSPTSDALVMSYGHGYDSDEARALAGSITSIMTGEAYLQSARMASAMGPFPGYRDSRATGFSQTVAADNVDSMQEVIRLHRQYCDRIENSIEFGFLKEEAKEVWNNAIRAGR